MPNIPLCDFPGASYLLFSANVPPLIYYSHLPIILISLLIGFFVYLKGRENSANQTLFWTTIAFSLWVLLDSIFWASNRSDIIMFVWSIILLTEPLVFIGCLYLVYVLIDKKDLLFSRKLWIGLLYLPLIIFVPTKHSLSGFDISSCLSVEGPIALYYTYFIESVVLLWIFGYIIKKYGQTKDSKKKKEILFIATGVILFLLAFVSGNLIGSFTENWNMAQAGLFGMPVFIGFLTYAVVKFKVFDIKFIGVNALMIATWILVASLFFIINLTVLRIVIGATLALLFIVGIFLIRSVKKEVESRERIEKLAIDLQKANDRLKELDKQKSEFVSFATHQLRSPLTAMKGYASLILEGDYGQVSPQIKEVIERVYDSTKTLTNVVDDYLNISRIELGTMKYVMGSMDFKQLVNAVMAELKPNIDKAGLKISLNAPLESYMISADPDKFKQVIMNVIDNSVKYTKQGLVDLSLEKKDGRVLFKVSDTGIGMNPEIIPKLFDKFTRADNANEANIRGTGLGLYVAKQIVIAHDGRIWAESKGEGQGSQFYVELLELK